MHFVDYEDISARPAAVCGAVLKAFDAERFFPAVVAYLAGRQGAADAAPNFRSGKSSEWREQMPETMQRRLWELTSPLVRERMRLEP